MGAAGLRSEVARLSGAASRLATTIVAQRSRLSRGLHLALRPRAYKFMSVVNG